MKNISLIAATLFLFACQQNDDDITEKLENEIEYWVPDLFAAAGDSEVILNFKFPGVSTTGEEDLLDPDIFRVSVRSDNMDLISSIETPIDSLKITVEELTNGNTYHFKVDAIVHGDIVATSNSVSTKPRVIPVPKSSFPELEPEAFINSVSHDKAFLTYTINNQLKLYNLDTQEVTDIASSSESSFFTADWAHNSNEFVYRYTDFSEGGRITTLIKYDTETGEEIVILDRFIENGFGTLSFSADDSEYYFLVYVSEGENIIQKVWTYDFDQTSLDKDGVYNLDNLINLKRISSFSNDGQNFFVYGYIRDQGEEGFYRINHLTNEQTRISDFFEVYHGPRISPDNKRFAFTSDVSGKEELWTYDFETNEYNLVSNTTDSQFMETPHFIEFRWINNSELRIILYDRTNQDIPNNNLILNIE